MLTAATRRGCVTPIIPGVGPFASPYPASNKNCGTCVVLPLPVAPQTTTTSLLWIASMIFCSSATTGRFMRASCTSEGRSTVTLYAFLHESVAVVVASSGGRGSFSGARGWKFAGFVDSPANASILVEGVYPTVLFRSCVAQALNADDLSFRSTFPAPFDSSEDSSSGSSSSELASSSSSSLDPSSSSSSEPSSSSPIALHPLALLPLSSSPEPSPSELKPSHSGSTSGTTNFGAGLAVFFLFLIKGFPSSSRSSGLFNPVPKDTAGCAGFSSVGCSCALEAIPAAILLWRTPFCLSSSSSSESVWYPRSFFSGRDTSLRIFSFFSTSMPACFSCIARVRMSRLDFVVWLSCFELWKRLVSTLCAASFLMMSRFSSFLSLLSCMTHVN